MWILKHRKLVCAVALAALCLFATYHLYRWRMWTDRIPQRVTIWYSGLAWGYTEADLQRMRISAAGSDMGVSGQGESALSSALAVSERRGLLRLLAKADIRRFRPESEWFTPDDVHHDESVVFVFEWPGEQLVLRYFPCDRVSRLPEDIRAKYAAMQSIGIYMSRIRDDRVANEKSSIRRLSKKEINEIWKVGGTAYKKSLPSVQGH
jgi:hypothetical protein